MLRFKLEMYTINISEYSVTDTDVDESVTWPFTEVVTGAKQVSMVKNDTNSSDGLDELHCSGWGDAQHALFQLANLCMLLSFLTPYKFRYHSFFLRIMINVCFFLTVIWSALFACMVDMLIWNSLFVIVNSVQLCYIGYNIVPDKFSNALEDEYTHMFKPLKVTRTQFKGIADLGAMHLLGKGTMYAKQDQSTTGQKLSILLKGR